MLSGNPDSRLNLLAEGIRTAARLARVKAQPGLMSPKGDRDESLRAVAFDKFANELDSVALRLEQMTENLNPKSA